MLKLRYIFSKERKKMSQQNKKYTHKEHGKILDLEIY